MDHGMKDAEFREHWCGVDEASEDTVETVEHQRTQSKEAGQPGPSPVRPPAVCSQSLRSYTGSTRGHSSWTGSSRAYSSWTGSSRAYSSCIGSRMTHSLRSSSRASSSCTGSSHKNHSPPWTPHRRHSPPWTPHRSHSPPWSPHRSHSPPWTPYRSHSPPWTPHRRHSPPWTPHRSHSPPWSPHRRHSPPWSPHRRHSWSHSPHSWSHSPHSWSHSLQSSHSSPWFWWIEGRTGRGAGERAVQVWSPLSPGSLYPCPGSAAPGPRAVSKGPRTCGFSPQLSRVLFECKTLLEGLSDHSGGRVDRYSTGCLLELEFQIIEGCLLRKEIQALQGTDTASALGQDSDLIVSCSGSSCRRTVSLWSGFPHRVAGPGVPGQRHRWMAE
ncbi:foot protein 1 variant 1-like [Symphalangus syndactylus]|uniref:foot protein 1 variant 1-like n=1 Tax=Symphalangus syndactylus TaxID=9590 RepID=UPI002442D8F2|nr:foot protein 1 variant 1-like [Symphalangus syndactylus]